MSFILVSIRWLVHHHAHYIYLRQFQIPHAAAIYHFYNNARWVHPCYKIDTGQTQFSPY